MGIAELVILAVIGGMGLAVAIAIAVVVMSVNGKRTQSDIPPLVGKQK